MRQDENGNIFVEEDEWEAMKSQPEPEPESKEEKEEEKKEPQEI